MSENTEQVREQHGLFKNVPRFLRRAVERRLAELEDDPLQFDREALIHFERLKRLHALLHIKPGERAREMFFHRPPEQSSRAALRRLVACRSNPEQAAALVREHRIPFLLAEAALGQLSEPVAIALVDTMDAAELVGRLPLLARRGLLAGPVRDAILRRLGVLAGDPAARMPYAKIESVVRYAELDRQVATGLFRLVETGTGQDSLQGDTALILDVSGSMAREGGSLELAAGTGWRVDRALEPCARLHVCLAGLEGTPVNVRRASGLDVWRRVCTVAVPETPGTSIGAAVERLARDNVAVSRLILVTDGYENRPPRLTTAYERYRTLTGQRPSLHLVQPANSGTQLSVDLKNAQIPFGVFTVDHHQLGLDALVGALQVPLGESRLTQILAFE